MSISLNSQGTNKAFTLIELLVVITIIGILATIVLSSGGKSKDKANDVKIKSYMDDIAVELQRNTSATGIVCKNIWTNATQNTSYGISVIKELSPNKTAPIAPDPNIISLSSTPCIPSSTPIIAEWVIASYLNEFGTIPGANKNMWCIDSTGYKGFIPVTNSNIVKCVP